MSHHVYCCLCDRVPLPFLSEWTCLVKNGFRGRTVGRFRASRRVLISCLRGDLPPSCSTSFFVDATGGYPGGVWYSTFLYVTARPATEAPVTALYLRGRRCTAAPNGRQPTITARTETSVAPWYDAHVATQALYGLSGWSC